MSEICPNKSTSDSKTWPFDYGFSWNLGTPISSIEEIDHYVSRYQRKHKDKKKGALRISENQDGCWIWTAATNATLKERREKRKVPYGRLALDDDLKNWLQIYNYKAKFIRTHVLLYHLYKEDLNEYWEDIAKNAIEIAHECGKSLCCNPSHLRLATRKNNTRDRVNDRKSFDRNIQLAVDELNWWRKMGLENNQSYPNEPADLTRIDRYKRF